MSGRDNDSLEDFFRKATSHHDLQFNEDDWSKMEKMLDKHFDKPAVAWGRFRIIGGTALVVVTGILALLLWRGLEKGGDDMLTTVSPTPQTEAANSEDSGDNAVGVRKENDKAAETAPDIVNQPQGSPNDEVEQRITGNEAATPPRQERTSRPAEPRRENEDLVVKTPNPELPRTDIATGEPDSDLPVLIPPIQEPDSSQVRTDPEKSMHEGDGDGSTGMAQAGLDQPVDSALAAVTADAPDSRKTVEAAEPQAAERSFGSGRFGFSIIAAPDFSMTTRGGAMGAGEAVGLMVHYQVFNRWGITAGVLHNTKKYWGRGDEYHPPTGYWKALTNGLVPDRIEGTCAMYEFPVSLTFEIVQTRRSRLFASAGLSSYFMESEDYYYKFDDPNPGAVNGWSGDRPATLWFGIGTLSVGYDFKATRTLSFGVEPYLKVPLEGIGWADIDLYSTGLMFAARYRFMKNGNKHPPPSQGP